MITKDEIYNGGKGYKNGTIQKRTVFKADTFFVNKLINLVSGMIAIMRKEIVSMFRKIPMYFYPKLLVHKSKHMLTLQLQQSLH